MIQTLCFHIYIIMIPHPLDSLPSLSFSSTSTSMSSPDCGSSGSECTISSTVMPAPSIIPAQNYDVTTSWSIRGRCHEPNFEGEGLTCTLHSTQSPPRTRAQCYRRHTNTGCRPSRTRGRVQRGYSNSSMNHAQQSDSSTLGDGGTAPEAAEESCPPSPNSGSPPCHIASTSPSTAYFSGTPLNGHSEAEKLCEEGYSGYFLSGLSSMEHQETVPRRRRFRSACIELRRCKHRLQSMLRSLSSFRA
ncbi:hypothetical protein BDY19DRAFT_926679 [Irpex rosettiformis]|uniref:Uncharacterized protein n=1 Tax=Irpex rosettiformis TaxID=378272 RepID=A0ACB8UF99_9APHY|nr:hypothetical protein BDY19DRAFT_926679 [Irpex rosettiformis]